MSWRFLSESVQGKGHVASEQPCQDFNVVSTVGTPSGDHLIAVCADGAGSASRSAMGAKLACEFVVSQIAGLLVENTMVGAEAIRQIFADASSLIEREAQAAGLVPRDFACTLLVAVSGPRSSVFAQVGDGAIVVRRAEAVVPVFWPQTGEYHNTTYFVTEPRHQDHLLVMEWQEPVDELALMTDGLQMLALQFADRTAHQPFFQPLFSALRGAANVEDLVIPFRQFLNADAVNARTDDDKTLVIAVRVDGEDAPG